MPTVVNDVAHKALIVAARLRGYPNQQVSKEPAVPIRAIKSIHDLSATERAMLELLCQGVTGRELASRLGYKDGTARVYLHTLYKRIGVHNKTAAARWYSEQREGVHEIAETPIVPTSMGAFATLYGLDRTLGAKSVFLGPHALGDSAMPKKPNPVTRHQDHKMAHETRALWDSFVAGQFDVGKRAFDQGMMASFFVSAHEGAILLAAHLAMGGYSASAQRARKEIMLKRSAKIGAGELEIEALTAISAAIDGKKKGACDRLVEIGDTARKKGNGALEQLVLVALIHLYRAQEANDKAEVVIGSLWGLAQRAANKWGDAGNAYMPR